MFAALRGQLRNVRTSGTEGGLGGEEGGWGGGFLHNVFGLMFCPRRNSSSWAECAR